MKTMLSKVLLATSLALASLTVLPACGDDAVDSNSGKAISDLDIGGDRTIDKGQTQQMTATVEYADGTTLNATSSTDLVWNIGNTGVATISREGVVTAVSVGATTIKATYQGKESSSQALIVK